MGEIELLALYWTVAGPVEVHVGREWSLFDWRDRCAEAARAGFRGLGLWHADIEHQLETSTLRGDAAGLRRRRAASTCRSSSWPTSSSTRASRRAPSPTRARRLLFDTAAAFDAHHIKVGNIPGTPVRARPADRGVRRAVRATRPSTRTPRSSTSSCRST